MGFKRSFLESDRFHYQTGLLENIKKKKAHYLHNLDNDLLYSILACELAYPVKW